MAFFISTVSNRACPFRSALAILSQPTTSRHRFSSSASGNTVADSPASLWSATTPEAPAADISAATPVASTWGAMAAGAPI